MYILNEETDISYRQRFVGWIFLSAHIAFDWNIFLWCHS